MSAGSDCVSLPVGLVLPLLLLRWCDRTSAADMLDHFTFRRCHRAPVSPLGRPVEGEIGSLRALVSVAQCAEDSLGYCGGVVGGVPLLEDGAFDAREEIRELRQGLGPELRGEAAGRPTLPLGLLHGGPQ